MKKIIIILSLLCGIAYAEHGVNEKHYELYWQQIPGAGETCILFHTYNKSEVKMKIKKGV